MTAGKLPSSEDLHEVIGLYNEICSEAPADKDEFLSRVEKDEEVVRREIEEAWAAFQDDRELAPMVRSIDSFLGLGVTDDIPLDDMPEFRNEDEE